MSKKQIAAYNEAHAILSEAGIDYEHELMEMDDSITGNMLPRVRIEHRDNGKHRLYFDLGESYFDAESEIAIKENTLDGVIVAHQHIRALWKEGDVTPTCSAVDNLPNVAQPQAKNCSVCPHSAPGTGDCKPKIRLMVLTRNGKETIPVMFALSPTSIKHWNNHLRKLKRSGLPPIAVMTRFTLEDIKKNGYRWAEVKFDVNGIAPKDMLIAAADLRREYEEHLQHVNKVDFSDPGDRAPEQEVGF